MAWGEELMTVVVYVTLAVTIWIFVHKRQVTVRKLCYFPVVQCKPIRAFALKVTANAFGLNWQWGLFTEAGELAKQSEFPFLADLQPVFHYNLSDFPTAMELRFGTRSLIFDLTTPSGPGNSCEVEGLKGRYWPEAQRVTEWLENLFGVQLTLGKVELDGSPVVRLACDSSWDGEKQRANILLDCEELTDTIQIDSVRLKRRAGGYEVETAGCVQQISTCWA
jgi:hypothetical protein